MNTYRVTITGTSPLLMHRDNIDWADYMEKWKTDPSSKKESKAGDDRSPAWRWIGCLYHDNNVVSLPADNLMRAIMEGAARVPVPGGKNGLTFKSASQSGMVVSEPYWPLLLAGGRKVAMSDIEALRDVKDFASHREAALELGFTLHTKRAKIGSSKHVRVRPMFSQWSASGAINVWDEQITQRVLTDILSFAGRYKGLCDWRPGGKTPGSFGMFEAEVRAT